MSTPADLLPEIVVTARRPGTPSGKRPRGIVQLGPVGALATVPGWVSWSVTNNSYQEADTFRIVYAAKALPPAFDALWFSQQKEIFAQIYAGFPKDPANPRIAELDNLIYGRVDEITYNPKTRDICLTGRDLTACFIDSRVQTQYKNQKSSQIATTLAQSHGLDTSQITPTTANVGTYFNGDQVQIAANRSEWDILCYLAREEGFVVYVSGNKLYFEPDPTGDKDPYLIKWQEPQTLSGGSPVAPVEDLSFCRSLTVAKGISVTARSPNTTTGRAVVQSYPTGARAITAGRASPFGVTQPYYVMLGQNMTPFQVAAQAQKAYETIVSHEMKMTASMPADNVLFVGTPINIIGTKTAFDQIYYPRLVTREMSNDEGYRMMVEAQNTSADL